MDIDDIHLLLQKNIHKYLNDAFLKGYGAFLTGCEDYFKKFIPRDPNSHIVVKITTEEDSGPLPIARVEVDVITHAPLGTELRSTIQDYVVSTICNIR